MFFVLLYLDYLLLLRISELEGLPTGRVEPVGLFDLTPLTRLEMVDRQHLNLQAIWAWLSPCVQHQRLKAGSEAFFLLIARARLVLVESRSEKGEVNSMERGYRREYESRGVPLNGRVFPWGRYNRPPGARQGNYYTITSNFLLCRVAIAVL